MVSKIDRNTKPPAAIPPINPEERLTFVRWVALITTPAVATGKAGIFVSRTMSEEILGEEVYVVIKWVSKDG